MTPDLLQVALSLASRMPTRRHILDLPGAAVLLGTLAGAQDIIVPDDQPTVQAALVAALPGQEILVRAGTYNEAIDFLGKDVIVRGEGIGPTILHGAGIVGPLVTFSQGETPAAELSDMTIANGERGIYCLSSSPTLRRLAIRDNHNTTSPNGAGMYAESAALLIESCSITGNSLNGRGAGIALLQCNAVMRDCRIQENHSDFYVGGLYSNGSLLMEDCRVLANTAMKGGGLGLAGSGVNEIRRTVIAYNRAGVGQCTGGLSGCYGNAGGVALAATALFDHCAIYGNTAANFGAAIDTDGGLLGTGSNLAWNGLAEPQVGTSHLKQTIVWGNSGGSGGGVYYSQSPGQITSEYCDVQASLGAGTGDISEDPLICSVGFDFRTQTGSPCQDAGDPSAPLDPDGSRADIGLGTGCGSSIVREETGVAYAILPPGSVFGCRSAAALLGGHLVSIEDAAEQTWLVDTFGTFLTCWIGLSDEFREGAYRWDSGSPVSYTNWEIGQPDNRGPTFNQDHVVMNWSASANGGWNDRLGTEIYSAIVELDGDKYTKIEPTSGHTYHYLAGGTVTQARTAAAALGGHLVTINSQSEQTWIGATFDTQNRYWIGLSDEVVEGQFLWDSGEPVGYLNWNAGEPNNGGGGQDHVIINFDDDGLGQWNDQTGTSSFFALIEVIALNASFACDRSDGRAPLTVHFTDTSSGTPTSWLWDFGDGATSVLQHPEHTYLQPGDFTLSLTVTRAAEMDTLVLPEHVHVRDAPRARRQ